MKKKLALVLAVVAVLSSFTIGALSAQLVEKIEAELRGDFEVFVDGKKQNFRDVNGNEVEPILYAGTTYLPVRAIGELMGKTVYWYQDEKKIELVEPSDKTLVTDADVIVDGADKVNKDNKVKNEKATEPALEAGITLEEAKAAVLKKAGLNEADVVYTKAKLDRDDGRLYYDIDFKTDTEKYDAEVNAQTGDVVEWEVERIKKNTQTAVTDDVITLEKAKAIALDRANLNEADVAFVKAELDYDDGRKVYEIEFKKDRIEYEAEINAVDGTIIEWNVDND